MMDEESSSQDSIVGVAEDMANLGEAREGNGSDSSSESVEGDGSSPSESSSPSGEEGSPASSGGEIEGEEESNSDEEGAVGGLLSSSDQQDSDSLTTESDSSQGGSNYKLDFEGFVPPPLIPPREKPVVHIEVLKIALSQLLDMYIDEHFFRIGHEIGRLLRWGDFEALGILEDVSEEHKIVDEPGYDIFGNPLAKKVNFEVECTKCHRTLAASRFAHHLEKCMGMGRNSARVATRRIAATSSNSSSAAQSGPSAEASKGLQGQGPSSAQGQAPQNAPDLGSDNDHVEEDDDDEDWSMDRKKKTKKPNDKGLAKRKGALSKVKNTEATKRRVASPSVPVQEATGSATGSDFGMSAYEEGSSYSYMP